MNEQLLQQIDELFTRRIGVFAEDVQHKFDLLIEGQQGLDQRLGRVEDGLERVEQRVTILEVKVDHLTVRVDGHDARFDRIDAKVDAIATDLADHRRDTEAHCGYRVSE